MTSEHHIEVDKVRSQLNREGAAQALADYVGPVVQRALMDATRCCITCDNFREHKGEICALTAGLRPPARVIAFGCPSYVNEVPF